MSNSERGKYYRRRRKLYSAHLEERVAALHEEIAALTVSRQVQQELALSQRFTPLGAAANIVNEYCSLFNHGAPVRLTVDDQDVSASLVAHVSNTQRGFLQAVMNADLRFGEFYGVGLLFHQWERYSLYHAAIKWTMKSLKVIELTEPGDLTPCNGSSLVVTITADLRVRISRRTIEEVFPHLVGDEGLMQLLIGQEVTYPCINHFHFNRNGKIEWYTPEINFIGGLTEALKRPELVAYVMENALIEKDHMIGNKNDGRQLADVKEVTTESCERFSTSQSNDWLDVSDSWKNELEATSESSFDQPDRLKLAYILAE
ncbi:unnamed protein product [Peronospora farinosa]|uniref:BZIP domain-containing protein n=1 Tax=Peronospora farinosa TaxID=134698 RepID=A0AAV0UAE7_9STRA|nr:unnamed protein product [Peronospora farinosa]CAI5731904.1 unnamed protein product [Peronospora farinosa]